MKRFQIMRKIITHLEESFIALLLAGMTVVTFSQVVARYVFNTGAIWALELTTYLFAWLVLFGVSYGVKTHAHIGVDAFVKLFRTPVQKVMGLLSVAASLTYAGILLYGAWTYVSKIHMIGIEAEDLPVPMWVPLAILPIGMALLTIRLLQAFWGILTHKGEVSILGDEGKDAIDHFVDDGDEDNRPKEEEK